MVLLPEALTHTVHCVGIEANNIHRFHTGVDTHGFDGTVKGWRVADKGATTVTTTSCTCCSLPLQQQQDFVVLPGFAAYVILWDYYVVHNLFVASYGLIHFQEPIRVAAKEMSEAFFFSLMHLKTDDYGTSCKRT